VVADLQRDDVRLGDDRPNRHQRERRDHSGHGRPR
jgi:hypothetical protein